MGVGKGKKKEGTRNKAIRDWGTFYSFGGIQVEGVKSI